MLRSLLIGLVAGSRSMTPLAAVSLASAAHRLPRNNGAPVIISRPLPALGAVALAMGELFGDKMRTAPDRIVPAGMAARLITGAIAGAALAPRRDRVLAGAVGASAAVIASYVTFGARMKALRRYGQTPSGLVEDALVLACAALIVAPALRRS
jgi:uncharacterized membrane protein